MFLTFGCSRYSPFVTYRKLERRLLADGWVMDRKSGSHRIYEHEGRREIIVLSGHHLAKRFERGYSTR